LRLSVPADWLEKARFFLSRARRSVEEGVYWAACFEAQQAVELALKGLQVALLGVHEFTHDLSRLLRGLEEAGVNVPQELYVYADALTPHYTVARHPGRKPSSTTRLRRRGAYTMARRSGGECRKPFETLRRLASINLDSLLAEFVKRVARQLGAVTLVLFGSRARGDQLPYSDYDVAAVFFQRLEDRERIVKAEELYRLKPPELPLDPVVLDTEDLEDPLTRKMLENCVTLYDGLKLADRLPCRTSGS
jgi:HEPN domain-containing protein/predicted nucleotidyltransferase